MIADVLLGANSAASMPHLPVLDYGSAVVMPGLIDVHVHMNEPGREEWEGGCDSVCA